MVKKNTKFLLILVIILTLIVSFSYTVISSSKYSEVQYIEIDNSNVEVKQSQSLLGIIFELIFYFLNILVGEQGGNAATFTDYSPAAGNITQGDSFSIYVDTVGNADEHYYSSFVIQDGQKNQVLVSCSKVTDDSGKRTVSTYNKEAGTKLQIGVQFYEDSLCTSTIGGVKKSDTYTVISKSSGTGGSTDVDPPAYNPLSIEEITSRVGSFGYCNQDAYGNKRSCASAGITNVYVCIAYSQVGYKEKASNDQTDSCTNNGGSSNYQKYGNNGGSWCSAFVSWVGKKMGLTIKDSTSGLLSWAKSSNRLHTEKNILQAGDLILYLDKDEKKKEVDHVAIYDGSGAIHGNWGNMVKKVTNIEDDDKNIVGYINMDGITR